MSYEALGLKSSLHAELPVCGVSTHEVLFAENMTKPQERQQNETTEGLKEEKKRIQNTTDMQQ